MNKNGGIDTKRRTKIEYKNFYVDTVETDSTDAGST